MENELDLSRKVNCMFSSFINTMVYDKYITEEDTQRYPLKSKVLFRVLFPARLTFIFLLLWPGGFTQHFNNLDKTYIGLLHTSMC